MNSNVLGTAVVRLETDDRGLDKGFANAQKKAEGFGAVMKGALGTALGFAGAQVGLASVSGAFDFLIGNAAGFEQALDGVQAATGATTESMELMRKEALRIGQDTSKSASEAVEAMGELAKAGMDVETILNGGADAAVALAEATGIDVPRSAVLISNAMNTWKREGLGASEAANLFAKAANASAISVDDLGMSLAAVGPLLPSVGMSMEDFAVAMGLMGNNALRGSDAGTSLKAMLSGFTPSSVKAGETMDAIGFSAFNAAGEFKSMEEILDDLTGALEGMTEEQRATTLEILFGSDGVRAANILLKEGSKGWQEFTKSMAEAPDVAEQARIRMGNFRGVVEQLKGTLETISITIGTMLLPALTALGTQLLTALNGAASWITENQAEIEGTLRAVGLGLMTIGEGISAILDLIPPEALDLAGMMGLVAFVAFIGPAGVFAAAIMGIIFTIGLFRSDIESLSPALLKVRLAFTEMALSMIQTADKLPKWAQDVLGVRDALNENERALQNEIDAIEDEIEVKNRAERADERLVQSKDRATAAGISVTEQLKKEIDAYTTAIPLQDTASDRLRAMYDAYIKSGGAASDFTWEIDELTGAIVRSDTNLGLQGEALIGANYQMAIGKDASYGMAGGMNALGHESEYARDALWGCVEAAQNVTASAYAAKQMLGQTLEVAADLAVVTASSGSFSTTGTVEQGADLYGPAYYADGGRPTPGMPAWVGERGQELWIPDQAGTILSHEDSMDLLNGVGGGGVTVNMPNATILAQDKTQARRSTSLVGWGIGLAAHNTGSK